MKKLHLIVFCLVVAGLSAWQLISRERIMPEPAVEEPVAGEPLAREGGPAIEETKESEVVAREDAVKNEAAVTPSHPVSLPAYFNRTFDGRDLKLGQVLAKNSMYTRYFIAYTSGNLSISGIMNVPASAEAPMGKPAPVLILNHGHIDTAVYTNGRGLKREQDYLARQGYVVIHPDYRNHAQSDKDPESEHNLRMGYTEDVINVVYAVRNSSLGFLDKERIGMLGHSMGGGISQNIAVIAPDLVKAIVLFAPVSADYVDNFNKWTRGDEARKNRTEEIVARYGSPEDNPEFWRNVSAINFFDRIQSPIMLHHGTQDESCPLEWSDRTAAALEAIGKDITYHIYEGEPHEFINAWPTVMERTTEFFDQYVKNS